MLNEKCLDRRIQLRIKSAQTEYSVTFENLLLTNQVCCRNLEYDNVLSIRNLFL